MDGKPQVWIKKKTSLNLQFILVIKIVIISTHEINYKCDLTGKLDCFCPVEYTSFDDCHGIIKYHNMRQEKGIKTSADNKFLD